GVTWTFCGSRPVFVPLSTRMRPAFTLVYVQVTEPPAVSVMLAVLPDRGPLEPPAPSQTRFVSSQPLTSVSVTDLVPGTTLVNVLVSESVLSLSSSRLKPDRPLPDVVKPKSCASLGWASLMIVIVPRFVVVNVHLTVSPASRGNVAVRRAW